MDSCEVVPISVFENLAKQCLHQASRMELKRIDRKRIRNNYKFMVTVQYDDDAVKTLHYFGKDRTNGEEEEERLNALLRQWGELSGTFKPVDLAPQICFTSHQVLLFEDLAAMGYQHAPPHTNLDANHVKRALEVLAKFHAGSFAIEAQHGSDYRLIDDYDLDVNWQFHTIANGVVEGKEEEVKNAIDSLDCNDDYRMKLFDLIELVKTNLIDAKTKFRNSLCHSNLRLKNIMFNYSNQQPVGARIINFKINNYAPPIYDVLQLVFFTTTEEQRQQNYHKFLNYYHAVLRGELLKYDLEIDDFLSEQDLHVSANYYLPLIKLEVVMERAKTTDRRGLNEAFVELRELMDCPRLTREDCYGIVAKKIASTDYRLIAYDLVPLEAVTGFLGDYFKLKIEIERNNSSHHLLRCFVKCMPKGASSRNIVNDTGCFFKEVFFYQKLVPMVAEMGMNGIRECIGECYFQRAEDLMVFEDLSALDYSTLSSSVPFDDGLLHLILAKLAQFHGNILAFEERMGEKSAKSYRINEHYPNHVQEVFFLKHATHLGAKVMQTGVRSIKDAINLFSDLKTNKNEERFEQHWTHLENDFYELIKPSEKFRNVLNHGDLWTSNILVRKLDNNQIVDCRFVDFQITRYCPPAHDVLMVLYITTSAQVRKNSIDQLIRFYHDELRRILNSYNCNIDRVVPFDQFVESLDHIRPQVIMQTIMYHMFGMCTPDEIKSFLVNDEICNKVFFVDRKEYLEAMCKKSPVFCQKIREDVIDLYELIDFLSGCKTNYTFSSRIH